MPQRSGTVASCQQQIPLNPSKPPGIVVKTGKPGNYGDVTDTPGDRVAALITLAGETTQTAYADLIGASAISVGRWVNNKRLPNPENYASMAELHRSSPANMEAHVRAGDPLVVAERPHQTTNGDPWGDIEKFVRGARARGLDPNDELRAALADRTIKWPARPPPQHARSKP